MNSHIDDYVNDFRKFVVEGMRDIPTADQYLMGYDLPRDISYDERAVLLEDMLDIISNFDPNASPSYKAIQQTKIDRFCEFVNTHCILEDLVMHWNVVTSIDSIRDEKVLKSIQQIKDMVGIES